MQQSGRHTAARPRSWPQETFRSEPKIQIAVVPEGSEERLGVSEEYEE